MTITSFWIQVFESAEALQLVMELAPGIELFDAILARQRFSEDEARPVFSQIASALAYLHDNRIVSGKWSVRPKLSLGTNDFINTGAPRREARERTLG